MPKHLLLIIPVGLYVFSLTLRAFHFPSPAVEPSDFSYGTGVLLWGWLGVIAFQFAWYANPFFVISTLMAFDGQKSALKFSIIAAALSLNTFSLFITGIPGSGVTYKVVSLGMGAYLWFFAIWALLIINVHISRSANKSAQCLDGADR